MRHFAFFLLFVSTTFILPSVYGNLTEEQAAKLLSAAWETLPPSMDISYSITERNFSKNEQEIRQMYEALFEAQFGPVEERNSFQQEDYIKTVEANVQRVLKEQVVGRQSRMRVRYDGKGRQRTDRVDGIPPSTLFKGTAKERTVPGKSLDATTPYEITEIETIDKSNIPCLYRYYHEGKTAVSQQRKLSPPSFLEHEVPSFMLMPRGPSLLLKAKTGDRREGGHWDPNEMKIDQLCSDSLVGILANIEPDEKETETRVKIEIDICNKDQNPYLRNILICDKNDYSNVYSLEVYLLTTETLIRKETRTDFDSQGFPHQVTVMDYNPKTGEITSQKTYQIENVQINPIIPGEIFEFNPPRGYNVVDTRDPKKFQAESQRQAAEHQKIQHILQSQNADDIKTLLSHPDWKIRTQSLVMLQSLLRNDSQELLDIVDSMKNDAHPMVRKRAMVILDSLKN